MQIKKRSRHDLISKKKIQISEKYTVEVRRLQTKSNIISSKYFSKNMSTVHIPNSLVNIIITIYNKLTASNESIVKCDISSFTTQSF